MDSCQKRKNKNADIVIYKNNKKIVNHETVAFNSFVNAVKKFTFLPNKIPTNLAVCATSWSFTIKELGDGCIFGTIKSLENKFSSERDVNSREFNKNTTQLARTWTRIINITVNQDLNS